MIGSLLHQSGRAEKKFKGAGFSASPLPRSFSSAIAPASPDRPRRSAPKRGPENCCRGFLPPQRPSDRRIRGGFSITWGAPASPTRSATQRCHRAIQRHLARLTMTRLFWPSPSLPDRHGPRRKRNRKARSSLHRGPVIGSRPTEHTTL
jgi:hypothetical protein